MRRNTLYFMAFSWMLLTLFIFNSPANAESKQTYRVGTNDLNVRAEPDHNAEVIGKLDAGDSITGFNEQNGWVQTYYNGDEAWIASQFLTKGQSQGEQTSHTESNPNLSINADSVRLRSGPGTDYRIIDFTSKGDVYQVSETNGDWHKVILDDGSTAWIATSLTSEGANQQASSNNEDSQTTKDVTGSLNGYNIMLDPGHGGYDPGSFGVNGENEKDLTLKTAKTVAEKLRNAGATVLLTRSDDKYISPSERVEISQSYNIDAFISLHYNAYPSKAINGVSTHYYSNGADYQLAQNIQSALQKHTNFKIRGVQKDPFLVIRENNDLSVLVELGFITSPKDNAIIQHASHEQNVANAITEGLINYFN